MFKVEVPGKWILTGEHTVLRGGKALALPYPSFTLKLTHEEPDSQKPLDVFPKEMGVIAQSLIAKFQEGRSEKLKIYGKLFVENHIPTGAGLGSSASLCVAFCQWMNTLGYLDSSKIQEEATRLEGVFHGTSSGLDIATVASPSPILFSRTEGATPLQLSRIPKFTLHDTGLRMSTKIAVSQVAAFRERFPEESARIDAQMMQATETALKGLRNFQESSQGLDSVREALRLAGDCFDAWGLVPLEAKQVMTRLKQEGALETKITGAGGGGFVVALWE